MTMHVTLSSSQTETPDPMASTVRRYLDLLPLRPEFEDIFQFFLLVKLVRARTSITPSQLVKLLLEHRLTGLTLEHLAVKHHMLSFTEALELLGERRQLLARIAGSPA